MPHEMKRALRTEAIGVLRPHYDSEIVTGATAERQAQAAKAWVDEVAAKLQEQGGLFSTCLDFRFIAREGAICLQLISQEMEQKSLLPLAFGSDAGLSSDEVFEWETAEWQSRLRSAHQDHEITIVDLPALSTAALRTSNDPAKGRSPIATPDEIERAKNSVLPASMEAADIDGETFELSDRGTSDVPVWVEAGKVRGLPRLNSQGIMLQLISPPPKFGIARKLLLRRMDLTPDETATLARHARLQRPIEMNVSIAKGAGRTLLGAPAREVPPGRGAQSV